MARGAWMPERFGWMRVGMYLLGCILCLGVTSLNAYVLRGPQIIDEIIRHYGYSRSIMARQTVVVYRPDESGEAARIQETLRYRFPDRFRSEAVGNVTRIHVRAEDAAVTIVDDRLTQLPESHFDLYKDILLCRSRKVMIRRLEALGVNTRITSYARFKGKIVLVIGARRPDQNVPQLWVGRAQFRPLRWILPLTGSASADGAVMIDFQYDQWRRVQKAWYPMHISCLQDDRLVREMTVDRLEVNPAFPEALFDVEALKAKYALEFTSGPDSDVDEALDEVSRTIDEFRRKYE